MSDLSEFFPAPVSREIAGQRIEIREMTVEQTARFLAVIAPLTGGVENMLSLSWILGNARTIVDAIIVATDLDRVWVSALPARMLLPIIEGVIEANAPFFVDALPTFAQGLAERIGAMTDGLAPSST